MNKRLSILFIFMLIFQTISSSFILPSQSVAEGSEDSIFTGISFTDEDGKAINIDELDGKSAVHMYVDWSIKHVGVEEGSTETLLLPDRLYVEAEQQDILTVDATEIGAYQASSDGVVTVAFNEAITEYPEAEGTFVVKAVVEQQPEEAIEEEGSEANQDEDVIKEAKEESSEQTEPEATDESDEHSLNSEEMVIEDDEQEEEATASAASDVHPLADLGNIFEFDWFRLDGADVEDGHEVDFDGTYEVQFSWETDETIRAGDTASIPLPDVFLHWVNTPAQPIIVEGTQVGTFTINDGELIFTFDERIQNQSVQNGYVGFQLNFDREMFTEEWEQEIDFDNDGERDLTVQVIPAEVNTDLDKSGRTDSPVNAREVYWTVEIVNGADEPIENGTLADVIPEGLGEPRDFEVREITIDVDGNKVVGDPIDFDDPELTDNGFEMVFNSIGGRSGYQVEYITSIEDINVAQFTNDATFVSNDVDLEAQATVSGGERSNPIQKEGTRVWWSEDEEAGDQIRWTITVNENGMSIDDARVEDQLPDGLTIVPDSIHISLNGEDSDIEADGFPIKLGEVNSDQTYTITFLTDINWSEVNAGEYQENNGFTNIATLFDGDEELNNDDATVQIDRDPILEKVEAGNIDYENRTVTWEVIVNKANHPLGHVTVTDQLPDGLTLEDVEITGEDDEAFLGATYTEVDGLLTIELPDIGTETITIKYTTSIDFNYDDDVISSFTNTVGMDGDGVGEGGDDREVTIRPHANTYEKNFAGINYEEKTINWRLNVTPTREDINEGFTITDTFTNDGLILLPETVEITLGAEDLVPGDDYTLAPIDGGYQNGFTIVFHREIAKAELVVNFTTSYDEQFVDKDGNSLIPHSNRGEEVEAGEDRLYRNHAHFGGTTENNREIDEEDDASQRVREDAWNSGYKSGNLVNVNDWTEASDRTIAWQVYFNYNQHNIGDNVSVTDTLDYDGEILEETIKVSVYDVNAAGDTTITDTELTLGEDYTVNVDGNEFTVTFNGEVTERYVIEFETTVPEISELNYVNRATVTTEEGEYPYSSSVHYDRWDDLLDKEVLPNVREVYIGEELEWQITVNESLSRIRDAILTDTISTGLSFVEDSMTIVTGSGEELTEGTDYTLETETTEAGETVLNISFEEDLAETLTITYTTIVTAENGQGVNNIVDLNGVGIETVTRETEEITATQFSWVDGVFRQDRGAIELSKVDSITGEVITDSEATFELYRVVNDEEVIMGEFTTKNGILEVGNLFLGTYILREIEAPEGYRLSDKEIEIEVDEAYGSDGIVFEEEFNNISDAAIDIPVQKVWEDAENQDGKRSESIEVELLANGNKTDFDNLELNAENNWEDTFTGLPELDEAGEEITYTIEEVNVPEGYESNINGDMAEGFDITNSYTPEVTDISGTKTWDDADNQDGIRPEEITVNLLANGTEIDEQIVTAEDDWSYTFTDLPKFEAGEEITYAVTEDSVEEYTTTTDGYDITNTHTPEKRSVTVTKAWDDANNQDGKRSESVEIQLFANGDEYGETITLSDENEWTHTWTELAVNEAGEEITYTVEELDVHEDYNVNINDEDLGNVTITNSYEPEVTDISGTKSWEDADNQDGVRPKSITVNLLADGEEIDSQEVTAEDNWSYTFENLPVYQPGEVGEEITYAVTEDSVEGYTTTTDGYDIINTYTPDERGVTVTKAWDDANNQDGKRTEAIKVQLFANDEAYGEPITLSEENKWTHTWTELAVNERGEEITYSVEELNVHEDYDVNINDEDLGNVIITNSYTPEVIEVTGTKTWKDADNQDGTRPESITVNLLANGTVVDSIKITEADDWSYTFTDLPKYEAGEEIKYSITEDAVEGYETTINGYDITNTLIPEDETTAPGTEKPGDSDKEEPSTGDKTDSGDRMPDTATNIFNLMLIGAALLAIGLTLTLIYRKRRVV